MVLEVRVEHANIFEAAIQSLSVEPEAISLVRVGHTYGTMLCEESPSRSAWDDQLEGDTWRNKRCWLAEETHIDGDQVAARVPLKIVKQPLLANDVYCAGEVLPEELYRRLPSAHRFKGGKREEQSKRERPVLHESSACDDKLDAVASHLIGQAYEHEGMSGPDVEVVFVDGVSFRLGRVGRHV